MVFKHPHLNAWCELRSPSQQVGKGQAGAAELIVEPDAEVVQRNPRGQTRPQTLKLVRPLSAKAEGSVELLVDGFHNLADARYPTPKPLGPTPFASVAFGRADDPRPVTIEPSSVVVLALEALVDHVRSRSCRSCAPEPGVGSSPQGEEGLGQRLVLGGSGGEAEAGDHPRWVDGDEQAKAFVPPQAIGPADVGVASKPSLASALRVPNGHGRGVQSLVAGDASAIWHECQVQGNLLDETHARAHQPIELRAIGQGGESIVQAPSSVAVEVALAAEAAPPGEDGQGDNLAVGEGRLRAGPPFRWLGVAEVVDHDVECSEEGVHIEHGSVPFSSGNGIGKPTLVRGHLPLKFRVDNSHQAFQYS